MWWSRSDPSQNEDIKRVCESKRNWAGKILNKE
jgi:hypothetical protein